MDSSDNESLPDYEPNMKGPIGQWVELDPLSDYTTGKLLKFLFQ